ncbi:MAG TPA: DUF72 domain-containing protein [Geobacteraceae bacterium]
MAVVHVGCSGFSYPDWQGIFYPEGLPQRRWLAHYSSVFSSVELNVTFYRLLKPDTFERWREETPPGFVFAAKGSRFITHVKRLAEPEGPLERFFSGVTHLGEKLAAILWQFPPGLTCDTERLGRFLEALKPYLLRNALEFRHESWLREEVLEMCRAHNAALCMADWPPFIAASPLTADFVYIRRHGEGGSYSSCYSLAELGADAQRIRTYLATGRDVHIYFNNDYHGYAPRNALELTGLLA